MYFLESAKILRRSGRLQICTGELNTSAKDDNRSRCDDDHDRNDDDNESELAFAFHPRLKNAVGPRGGELGNVAGHEARAGYPARAIVRYFARVTAVC